MMDNGTIVMIGMLGMIAFLYMQETETHSEHSAAYDAPEAYPESVPLHDDGDSVLTPSMLNHLDGLHAPTTKMSPSTKNQSLDLRGDVLIPHAPDYDTNRFLNPHLTEKVNFTVCASGSETA